LVEPIKKLLNQMSSFTKISRDASEGGGLLWGVNSVVQVLHGNSRAKQVSKAIGRAKYAVETGLIDCLKSELALIGGEHNTCLNNHIRSVDNSPQIKKLSATR
jgi:fatty acid/phospholipid biosynthesis enzyme